MMVTNENKKWKVKHFISIKINIMPKFNITQVVKQEKSYEYTVEADTEADALVKLDVTDFDSVSDGDEEILSTFIKEC